MCEDLNFACKGGLLNVNLNFVGNINEAKLTKTDSLLILGKAKDLTKLQHSHISSVLSTLSIPDKVINHVFYSTFYFMIDNSLKVVS
jgi:hypothetical protein